MTARIADAPAPDLALWQAAVADARPLPVRPAVVRPEPALDLRARQAQADEDQVMDDALLGDIDPEVWATGEEAHFRREGIPARLLRKLRGGQFAIQGEIDLHGLDRQAAHHALRAFLLRAQERGWRSIKVIHGKGLRSPGGRPVLKARVEITLSRTDAVLAFCSAPPWAGGNGAVVALLRNG